MFDNSVLRANARKQLGNEIFGKTWLMMVLACFIFSALQGLAASTVVGSIIVLGPLSYGFCRMLVKTCLREKQRRFCGFCGRFYRKLYAVATSWATVKFVYLFVVVAFCDSRDNKSLFLFDVLFYSATIRKQRLEILSR